MSSEAVSIYSGIQVLKLLINFVIALHSWINKLKYFQHQLLHIGLKFLEHDTSVNRDPFVFVYKTPQVDIKDKITIALEIGDVKIIWNG